MPVLHPGDAGGVKVKTSDDRPWLDISEWNIGSLSKGLEPRILMFSKTSVGGEFMEPSEPETDTDDDFSAAL